MPTPRSATAGTSDPLFHADAAALAPLYPRFADFRDLAERMDPGHKFRNGFRVRKVFGGQDQIPGRG
jgi:hypothetical protein